MVRFEKRKSIAAFSWLTFFINSAVMQNQVSDSPFEENKNGDSQEINQGSLVLTSGPCCCVVMCRRQRQVIVVGLFAVVGDVQSRNG